MGLIDIYNIEGGEPQSKISWTTLAGVIVGWILSRITDLFLRYRKMVKTGNRFRKQIANSKKGYDKQLHSINNLVTKLKVNEMDNLSLDLKQQFNTIKSLDKSTVIDYYESWWYRLFHKKEENKPENFVDSVYSIVENSALEMKRLEKMFINFQNKMILAYSTYAKEVQDIKKEVDTAIEGMTQEEFANNEVLKVFGRLYAANLVTEEMKMIPIDMKLFQDLLVNFHSALSITFPVDQNNPLYRKIKDFNHSSSWIINMFNHTKHQMIGGLELIEKSMSESYATLYGENFKKEAKE